MFLIAGIFLFILLIVLHEYGHFLVAKRNGIEVEEFGIFFPPKLVGKKMGKGIFESYYTINMIPLGGFVKLKGENNQDTRKGSFGASSFWSKTKVMLAGVLTNYIIGALLFVGISGYYGIPTVIDNQWQLGSEEVFIRDVSVGLPADNSGLEADDQIVSFAGEELFGVFQLFDLIDENKGETVDYTYIDADSGQEVQSSTELRAENNDEQGILGAGLYSPEPGLPTRLANGFLFANQIALETFVAIGSAVSSVFQGDLETAGENASGPVGIVNFLANEVSDVFGLLFITANISIALAVANLLPIPGLDGGRFYTMAIFKLMNRELTEEVEQKINAVGVAILLTLIVLVTINDFNNFG